MNEKELVAHAITLGIKAKISDKKSDTIKEILEKTSIKSEVIKVETPIIIEYKEESVHILEATPMTEFDLTPAPRIEDVWLLDVL